jgi:hypothetical protein
MSRNKAAAKIDPPVPERESIRTRQFIINNLHNVLTLFGSLRGPVFGIFSPFSEAKLLITSLLSPLPKGGSGLAAAGSGWQRLGGAL